MRLSLFYGFVILWSMTICSCQKDSAGIRGCTNRHASNYDSVATIDDGSCVSLGSQYDGRFRLMATITNYTTYQTDTMSYIATMARMSPINNIITLSDFHGVAGYTASFIVNPGGIDFPKQQFYNPNLYIYSSADGTFYGNPYLDPTIRLSGDTLTLTYMYNESASGGTVIKYASVTGMRIP